MGAKLFHHVCMALARFLVKFPLRSHRYHGFPAKPKGIRKKLILSTCPNKYA